MIETVKRDGVGRIAGGEHGLVFIGDLRSPAFLSPDISPKEIFPHVPYPISAADLNEISGEGKYGAIYFGPDGLMKSHEAEVYWFPHLVELIGDPPKLVDAIVNARELVGPVPMIYAPAVGRPNHLALLTYLGMDIFDTIALRMAARKGVCLDENGEWREEGDFNELMERNMESALRELNLVKKAIENGRLRDIVEMRARSEPWLYATLRLADEEHWRHFEAYETVKGKAVRYPGPEGITRPEVMRFRERVLERWRPRGEVLLLLPCSARKPYSKSRTHRRFREILESLRGWGTVQEVILTSPMIMVPRELERYYPAGHYDAAVRGKWDYAEVEAMKGALHNLKRMGAFKHIIIHLPEDMDFVSDAIYGEWAAEGSVTSERSLENLSNALERALSDVKGESPKKRALWTLQAMAEFQFGMPGEDMLDSVKGRWPNIKGFLKGKQTVTFIEDKGALSLTTEGGKILAEKGRYRVFVGDFELRGDIFAIGVESADPEIREGDDVVVIQDGVPVAVGIAERSATEMVQAKKGVAVRVRKKMR